MDQQNTVYENRGTARSVLARVDRAAIVNEPHPYIVVPDALDPDYYAELAAAFPSMEKVVHGRPLENNKAYLLNAVEVIPDPEMPSIWRDFFEYHSSDTFFREALSFWAEPIAREYPDLSERFGRPIEEVTTAIRTKAGVKTKANDAADVMMDVQFGVNTPVTAISQVRGPHVDKPYKLFAGLLYFRSEDDTSTGGDLDLFRYNDRRPYFDGRFDIAEKYVERFTTVAYRPNTLAMWLNTPRSLHGVTPRSITNVPRRYVNIMAECYRLTTDGFFSVPRSPVEKTASTIRKALGFRDP